MNRVELAIVGAGPAGMAAGVLAAELGLDTMLVDEHGSPGGQIYRGVERAGADSPLGPDYLAGAPFAAALRASPVDYRPNTTLWHLDPDGTLYLIGPRGSETISARRILLATGAIERPVPIPGWTLPGVMTVGAAQILLKTADLIPEGRTVLAGQGPLLYLVAVQLAQAGAAPAVILETTPPANYRHALRGLRPRSSELQALLSGLGLIFSVRRAGIAVRRGVRGLRAAGCGYVERVFWEGGETAVDHLLLHEGVIPNLQVSLALQLRHEWDEAQLCWRPVLDPWGQTSLPCIAVAGDAAGIAGAGAARLSGQLAALDAAMLLGRLSHIERDRRAGPMRSALLRERALRPFLDRLYRSRHVVLAPREDETVVCRCEEVSAGSIRRAVRLGAGGPNQLKAFTRCGMGPCQGRICGPVAAAIIADELDRPVAEIGAWRPRAPFKPITVGALADAKIPIAEAAEPGVR
jgi:NADPH-dependent 2,4-dienoyl-CoA reductase/sulfur reductase-like enzyme